MTPDIYLNFKKFMVNKTHFMVNKFLKSFFEKKTLNLKKNYYCMLF